MGYRVRVEWQQKVRKYVEQSGTSVPKLAKRADIAYMTLKRALDTPDAWNVVEKAIRLAHSMGITVEALFDRRVPLPDAADAGPRILSWDERQAALEELSKLNRVDVLERIARGIPPESQPEPEQKPARQRRPRKRK